MKVVKKILGILLILFSIFLFLLIIVGIIDEDDFGNKTTVISILTMFFICSLYGGISLIRNKDKVVSKNESIYEKKYGKEEELEIDEYYIDYNKENLIKFARIVSNDKLKSYDFIDQDMALWEFAEKLTEEYDDILLYFDWKEPLETIVFETNNLMKNLGYNVAITEEQVTANDNEFITNRRNDYMITTDHDLNEIHNILEKQGYILISLPIDADGYWLAVVPIEKIKEIEQLREE